MKEQIRTWICGHKRWTIAALLVTAGLCVEFCLFDYGVLKLLRYVILLLGLWAVAWIDGKEKRIPNRILLYLLAARAVLLAAECIAYWEYAGTILLSAAGGALAGGGMFLVCYLIARGGMGAGDVKLMAVVGCYVGLGVIFTDVFLIVLVSALWSLGLLILRKATLKQELPFAPFVLAGTVLTMALGM